MSAQPVCEAYYLVAELAEASGAPMPLSQHSGCYEIAVDERWRIAFNGHDTPQEWHAASVPAFAVAVEYNGWPAGVMGPFGGWIAAGECANEDAFIAALKASIAALGQPA